MPLGVGWHVDRHENHRADGRRQQLERRLPDGGQQREAVATRLQRRAGGDDGEPTSLALGWRLAGEGGREGLEKRHVGGGDDGGVRGELRRRQPCLLEQGYGDMVVR